MPILRATKVLFLRSIREFYDDNGPQTAATIAYYVLFSIFPLLIFVISLAGIVAASESVRQDIVDRVLEAIPLSQGEGRNSVQDAVNGLHGRGGGVVGVAGALLLAWSATSMFGAIRKALNAAFDDEAAKRPFVPQKLMDLAMVFGLALGFLASLALLGALRYVRNSGDSLGGIGDAADRMGFLWDAASYVAPAIMAFLAFLALYSLVPGRIRSPARVWPGALVAAVLFAAGNIAFSLYLENFSNYNVVFGSLGAVVAFLFWLHLSAMFMLFGAEVASEYPRLTSEPTEQPALEGLKEPLPQLVWGKVRALFITEGKRETPVVETTKRQQPATGEREKRPRLHV